MEINGLLTPVRSCHFEMMPYSPECAESCDDDVNAYLVIELTAIQVAILTNGTTYTQEVTLPFPYQPLLFFYLF